MRPRLRLVSANTRHRKLGSRRPYKLPAPIRYLLDRGWGFREDTPSRHFVNKGPSCLAPAMWGFVFRIVNLDFGERSLAVVSKPARLETISSGPLEPNNEHGSGRAT
jgi:hypothetical protein